MEKTFKKHETLFCILLIVVYIVVNSYCIQNYGIADYRTSVILTIMSILLIILMFLLKRIEYYGLTKAKDPKKYLYFIPLVIIFSVNLWNGINTNHTKNEIVFHILTMINVGFLEEIIFRGFLFKMMAKDNLKTAIIVSSITFGIGHIVNLLNGAEVFSTLMQICYAIAIGYLFVTIFYKSKSLIPCILAHIFINASSIFKVETNNMLYIVSIFLVISCLGYTFYINKTVKD
ncbi:MAG: CPBP family intramembrane metalloprotease [Muribaculaceae bacterium]|nr:CPBP family intramembrane metalloprotease [Muribaculaceae bacterium]